MNARRRTLSPVAASATRLRVPTLVTLAVAAVYAGLASATTPFTLAAEVAVAVPSAVFAGVLLMERLRPDTGPWRRIDIDRPARGGSALPWLLVIVLLIGVELSSYFHGGPRANYPTVSSGMNALFHYRAAKAAVWWVWLTAGWHLARR